MKHLIEMEANSFNPNNEFGINFDGVLSFESLNKSLVSIIKDFRNILDNEF